MKPCLIGVFGPTASGKSDIALEMAKKMGAEILNCDSLQVYDQLNIGTAKPSLNDQAMVVHHLLGHVPVGQIYTAGQYRRDALRVIQKRFEEGQRLFLLVGGSGFYAQALIKGLYPIAPVDPLKRKSIMDEIESRGAESVFSELKARDPEYAKKIGDQDQHRLIRAIEILRHSEFKTMAEIDLAMSKIEKPFHIQSIGVMKTRGLLKKSILSRAEVMLKNGFIEEVQGLLSQGLIDWPPLRSVGYREVIQYLQAPAQMRSQKKMTDQIVTSSMQLAKRQMTWFRRDPETLWFDTDLSRDQACAKIEQLARDLLA
jgi:tRNA dimethylallyltransferase